MNDPRRKEIQRALTLIEQAKDILREALLQEQDDFDSMPEDLQNDETGQRAEGGHENRSLNCVAPAVQSFLGKQGKIRGHWHDQGGVDYPRPANRHFVIYARGR